MAQLNENGLPTEAIEKPVEEPKQASKKTDRSDLIGKEVICTSREQYISKDAKAPHGSKRTAGRVKVIEIAEGAKHEVRVEALASGVANGWVNKDSIVLS